MLFELILKHLCKFLSTLVAVHSGQNDHFLTHVILTYFIDFLVPQCSFYFLVDFKVKPLCWHGGCWSFPQNGLGNSVSNFMRQKLTGNSTRLPTTTTSSSTWKRDQQSTTSSPPQHRVATSFSPLLNANLAKTLALLYAWATLLIPRCWKVLRPAAYMIISKISWIWLAAVLHTSYYQFTFFVLIKRFSWNL